MWSSGSAPSSGLLQQQQQPPPVATKHSSCSSNHFCFGMPFGRCMWWPWQCFGMAKNTALWQLENAVAESEQKLNHDRSNEFGWARKTSTHHCTTHVRETWGSTSRQAHDDGNWISPSIDRISIALTDRFESKTWNCSYYCIDRLESKFQTAEIQTSAASNYLSNVRFMQFRVSRHALRCVPQG